MGAASPHKYILDSSSHVNAMHCTGKYLSKALLFAEYGENMYWTYNSMNNLSSYCGLVDAKIRASDKDLPVASLTKT